MPWDQNWERLYAALGISDFMSFITSSNIQDELFGIKVVFILFAAFFFCAVIYFFINSSYLKYQSLQDLSEFVSWQAYGLREVNRRWKQIMKKIKTDSEKEYKLTIVEAEDFLINELEDAEYQGNNLEELALAAGKKMLPNLDNILEAHKVRNAIVHDVNYKLDIALAKRILKNYEKAIKDVYSY